MTPHDDDAVAPVLCHDVNSEPITMNKPKSAAPSNDGDDDSTNNSTSVSSICPMYDESPPQNAIVANEKYPILCSTTESVAPVLCHDVNSEPTTMNKPKSAAPSNDSDDDSTNNSTSVSSICPICDESPSQNAIVANEKYPILCSTTECEYKMCSSCVSQMLSNSQKESPLQASDGNDFNIKLLCPNCRGHFCILLEDVLLLRRAEIWRLELRNENDMELSASELREKYFWDEKKLSELALAESRYEKDSATVLDAYAEKESLTGVVSVGSTITDGSAPAQDNLPQKIMKELDTMMLAGLEDTMSEAEQEYMTSFMTSGCPDKLAQAAELVASIAQARTTKPLPSLAQTFDTVPTIPMNQRSSTNRPSTAISLFQPAKFTRTQSAITPSRSNRPSTAPTPRLAIRTTSRKTSRRTSRRTSRQGGNSVGYAGGISTSSLTARNPSHRASVAGEMLQWRRLYPLPVRMPHAYAIFLNFDPYARWGCNLSFLDDEESFASFYKPREYSNMKENLVRDAFQRLSVGMWQNNMWKEPIAVQHIHAVNNLLVGPLTSRSSSTLVTPFRRVVISSVKGQLRQTGLQVGDVITHVNGEPFGGSSEDLRSLIDGMRNVNGLSQNKFGTIYPKMQIVVNADIGIAEVLRLRSKTAEAALKLSPPS